MKNSNQITKTRLGSNTKLQNNLYSFFKRKSLIITILLITITLTSVNAQIKVKNNAIKNKINLGYNKTHLSFGPLNLLTIKNNIKNRKSCYVMHLSTTAIIPPKNGQYLKDMVGYFGGSKYVKFERNHLRINDLLLRSDKNFSKLYGNNFEILIYSDIRNPKEINKNMVKLSWKLPETGNIVQTFNLRDVTIIYKPYGILITGNYNINGVLFGVSISITPSTCLI